MLDRLLFASIFLSALGAGLMAGLFFMFSAFGMKALARLPPPGGIAAMQSINVAILSPLFFVVFFGTAAASLVLGIVGLAQWSTASGPYLVAGSLLYIVGCIVVTMAFNVPLNNALAAAAATGTEAESVWTHYLSVWTGWNHVRTIACLAATASFIMALR